MDNTSLQVVHDPLNMCRSTIRERTMHLDEIGAGTPAGYHVLQRHRAPNGYDAVVRESSAHLR